ncbi:hypothetical protein RvY_07525-1 [Ramazzottius varieornatus]|uniref:Uncharacterized protein n=1 Tax=Ramazzottius varieornatus TaxID=947166 RepID=A0A1D1V2H9_RAMVA|nr:hypothetical protein RvY_07525-1 [Ramazzottius varieornatus]
MPPRRSKAKVDARGTHPEAPSRSFGMRRFEPKLSFLNKTGIARARTTNVKYQRYGLIIEEFKKGINGNAELWKDGNQERKDSRIMRPLGMTTVRSDCANDLEVADENRQVPRMVQNDNGEGSA